MKIKLFLAVALCFASSIVFAQVDESVQIAFEKEEARTLITRYLRAVELQEEPTMKQRWEELSKNKTAIEYFQKEFPQQFYLFQVRGFLYDVQTIQNQYEAILIKNDGAITTPIVPRVPENFKKILPEQFTNRQEVLLDPNNEQENNQIRAIGSPNQNQISNREQVFGSPNQNARSNQEIMRARREALLGK